MRAKKGTRTTAHCQGTRSFTKRLNRSGSRSFRTGVAVLLVLFRLRALALAKVIIILLLTLMVVAVLVLLAHLRRPLAFPCSTAPLLAAVAAVVATAAWV